MTANTPSTDLLKETVLSLSQAARRLLPHASTDQSAPLRSGAGSSKGSVWQMVHGSDLKPRALADAGSHQSKR